MSNLPKTMEYPHDRARRRAAMMSKRYEIEITVPGLDYTYPAYTNWVEMDEDIGLYVWVDLETRDQILCDLLKEGEEVGDLPFTKPESDGLVYLSETTIDPVGDRRVGVVL